MKKRTMVVMSLALVLMFCSSALAGSKTASGKTTGGTSGTQITCVATLVYGSTWANAGTDSDEYGTLKALAAIYFITSSGTE